MSTTKRKVDHIFRRPNSQFWQVRLQMDGRSIEKSLGVADRTQTEILASPMIAEHKARLRSFQ